MGIDPGILGKLVLDVSSGGCTDQTGCGGWTGGGPGVGFPPNAATDALLTDLVFGLLGLV